MKIQEMNMKIEELKMLEELVNKLLEVGGVNTNYQIKFQHQSIKLSRLDAEINNGFRNGNITKEQYKELYEIYKDFNKKLEKYLKD